VYEQQREGDQLTPEGLFLNVVEDEQARSERYNHYFCVVLLRADKVETAELLWNVRSHVRGSDIVGIMLPGGRYIRQRRGSRRVRLPVDWTGPFGAIGVLLPETDGEGAKVALKRILSLLSAEQDVRVGYAVYPEDSTDAAELLSLAAA